LLCKTVRGEVRQSEERQDSRMIGKTVRGEKVRHSEEW
jgi:hypothetical protein